MGLLDPFGQKTDGLPHTYSLSDIDPTGQKYPGEHVPEHFSFNKPRSDPNRPSGQAYLMPFLLKKYLVIRILNLKQN